LHNTAKSRTAEDALRVVCQVHARLPPPEPPKYNHRGIDFRIQQQIQAYAKMDDPPRCVKQVPIIIIEYILRMVYDSPRDVVTMVIADLIYIAFFFVLWPGEYTGTTSDDTPFRLQDVGVCIRDRKFDLSQCSDAELDVATSISYTFTTQKNGTRDENIVQGRSGNYIWCPVRATIR
jgi:hypothetical protein